MTRLHKTTDVLTYNDLIVIQQTTQSRTSLGEVVDTWGTYKSAWADIEDAQSNVGYEGGQPAFEDGKSFKIHTDDAPGVTTKMRISYDSTFFYIRSIRKEGRLRTILLADGYDDE